MFVPLIDQGAASTNCNIAFTCSVASTPGNRSVMMDANSAASRARNLGMLASRIALQQG